MDFPNLLAQLLEKRGLTQREFAMRVGRSQGFISDVLHGRNGPADDLERWGEVLGLSGKAKDRFVLVGTLARCPRLIRDYVARLEEEAAKRRR